MLDLFRVIVTAQCEAALAMLGICLERCANDDWDKPIAKYPFWQVAYHALCFADFYAAPSEEAWRPHPDLHPEGRLELDNEYPSRRFVRDELLGYAALCKTLAIDALAAETDQTIAGPCGFPRLRISRGELYLYNLRHIQHHTGQLSAFVHRQGGTADWVKSGWNGSAPPSEG